MFPATEEQFELTAELPRVKVGHLLMAFNVKVPEDKYYTSVTDESAVFVASDPTQSYITVNEKVNKSGLRPT